MLDVSTDYLLKDAVNENSNTEINTSEEVVPQIKSEATNHKDIVTTSNDTQGKRSGPSYTAIKVWTIIGMVLTPLSAGGLYRRITNGAPGSFYFFLLYLITIPIGCIALKKVKYAADRREYSWWAAATILFVSTIGGILMFC